MKFSTQKKVLNTKENSKQEGKVATREFSTDMKGDVLNIKGIFQHKGKFSTQKESLYTRGSYKYKGRFLTKRKTLKKGSVLNKRGSFQCIRKLSTRRNVLKIRGYS